MIRVLFSVLVVVVVVLAIVLEPYRTLLFAAAAVLLVLVATLWISVLRRRHRESVPPYRPRPKAPLPKEELKSLGIMDIRPKEPSTAPVVDTNGHVSVSEDPDPAPALSETADLTPQEPLAPLKEFIAQPVLPSDQEGAVPPPASTTLEEDEDVRAPDPQADEGVLIPYLRALRAALDADTVCVLRQAGDATTYQVLTLINQNGIGQADTVFSTEKPLMTTSLAQESMVVQSISEGGISSDDLGYCSDPDTIRFVALAPIARASDPAPSYLLADTRHIDFSAHLPTLLPEFARLLGTLLDLFSPAPPDSPPGSLLSDAPVTPEPPSTATIRPRRDIIAEEMIKARDLDQTLALALVYLNQAEHIADQGEAVVTETEDVMEVCLRQATEHGRVERFGELTYGVFYDGDLLEVEAWAAEVQDRLFEETGALEGGVSIGIAMLQDRHDTPDLFRADATEALREAYETGMCTILE